MDPLTSKLLDKLLDKAIAEMTGVVNIVVSSKTSAKELKEKLSSLKPTIDEIIKVQNPDSDALVRPYKKFQADLQEGLDLVGILEKLHSYNIFRKYRYGKKLQKFQEKVYEFIQLHGPPDVNLNLKKIEAYLRPERLIAIVKAGMTNDPNSNAIKLCQIDATQGFQNPSDHGMHEVTAVQQSVSCTYQVQEINEFVVGLKNPVNTVKKFLLQNGVNIVGVTGMGGSGKTTLAFTLYNDTQVKDFFYKKVFFNTVSQLHRNENGLLKILKTMWDQIIGGPRPHFRSIEDARIQLQNNLKRIAERTYRPTLMILNDVWFESDLEALLFEAKGYKTVVTTRENFTILKRSDARLYNMPMLEVNDYLPLFCFWAFGQPSIPTTEEDDLVKQVAAECKGLPLALKVIGSSLRNEPRPSWKSARNKLSGAKSTSQYYKDSVFDRLQMSIDILDDEPKECFLDLGAFPEGRKFSVDFLLDVWVYVRGMEWDDAFMLLLELAQRNLLNLTSDPGSRAIDYSCASEFCFSQHDIMRDLALRLASQDSIIQRKRLFMPSKAVNLPTEWLTTLTNQSSGAQFLSIHTGAMAEQDWCQIDFPAVEALALFFAASEYCLPTFIHGMPKLKVVFIYNYSSKRAKLHGLPSFSIFTQIKSVVLERLDVSALYRYCRSWESLENFSVCLCEGLGNTPLLDKEPVLKFSKRAILHGLPSFPLFTQIKSVVLERLNVSALLSALYEYCRSWVSLEKFSVLQFPKFIEINFDHCSDLEQLPEKICNLTSLQRLSVTNCHLIQKLPDDLGKLRSLRMLRLSACLNLSMLPPSICELHQLEFLDISLCGSLKNFPNEFHRLSKLKMLDMRECSRLKKLPEALAQLSSLTRVVCDENIEGQWRSIRSSAMHNLIIDVVQAYFGLDWLYD